MLKIKILIAGKKYFLCRHCGIYKADQFDGKIKKQKHCVSCLSKHSPAGVFQLNR